MLEAVVKSLGTVLEPEDLERAREVYARALASIEPNAAEFSHLQSRRLRTRLAHIAIRLARDGTRDCQALCEQAVAALRAEAPARKQVGKKHAGKPPAA
jgi:hypothetical protein